MARLVVRVLGEGVSGMRPPAVRVEKMPWWLLRGVDIAAVAIACDIEYVIEWTIQCFDQSHCVRRQRSLQVSSRRLTNRCCRRLLFVVFRYQRDPKSLN